MKYFYYWLGPLAFAWFPHVNQFWLRPWLPILCAGAHVNGNAWQEEAFVDEGAFVNESFGSGDRFTKEGYSFVPEGRKMKGQGRGPPASLPPSNSARSEQDRLREIAKWEERKQKKREEMEAKRRAAILERERVCALTTH